MKIQTRSGAMVNVLRLEQDTVLLEDIGHALATTNRFNGHTYAPYSVAQHSVLMAQMMNSDHDRLWALLHDAPEAYMGDLAKPIKDGLPDFQLIEEDMMEVITGMFGLSIEMPATVKEADKRIFVTEVRDLMADPTKFKEWGVVEPYLFEIRPWGWEVARDVWLQMVEDTHLALTVPFEPLFGVGDTE